MLQNYSQLVERIAKSSGLPVEDIDRRVEAKRAKLSRTATYDVIADLQERGLMSTFER